MREVMSDYITLCQCSCATILFCVTCISDQKVNSQGKNSEENMSGGGESRWDAESSSSGLGAVSISTLYPTLIRRPKRPRRRLMILYCLHIAATSVVLTRCTTPLSFSLSRRRLAQ